jgi:hypothetical protein
MGMREDDLRKNLYIQAMKKASAIFHRVQQRRLFVVQFNKLAFITLDNSEGIEQYERTETEFEFV